MEVVDINKLFKKYKFGRALLVVGRTKVTLIRQFKQVIMAEKIFEVIAEEKQEMKITDKKEIRRLYYFFSSKIKSKAIFLDEDKFVIYKKRVIDKERFKYFMQILTGSKTEEWILKNKFQ